jgi:hypothetical protein
MQNSDWKTRLSRAVPLALLAFTLVSAEIVVTVVDGPSTELYGFPLFWHWDGEWTSISANIRWSAFALDLGLYIAFFVSLSLFSRFGKLLEALTKVQSLAIWIAALLVFTGSLFLILTQELAFHPLFPIFPDWIDGVQSVRWSTILPESY